ncbi:MBL fold metallo-hydrolase [Candidatus Magnetominusculus xianensis]|uniref:MBL fold metallo-hydrolase n=1 Tax=Candidatus Magnetominusculus xianensis TaxID=1748249 RepID=A0ABR5SE64_9BACT|nr:MBL fold metallo-hydrolase [Candidatus Magnetominusculus xianensis]KWT84102.1 MBL fold metallo-hydrolase [Candidatus Magnetominusculus xianensis]
MGIAIRRIAVGQLEVNCYIVSDDAEAMVIDPGDEPDRILDYITEKGLKLVKILCTHTHFDHIGALPDLKEAFLNASVQMHKDEVVIYKMAKDMAAVWGFQIDPMPEPDVLLSEGSEVVVGGITFKVLHTPGHTPGGICLYGAGNLISGDTLFAGSVGRTDLPGGNMPALKTSFKRLMTLPSDTKVLPGHGPTSTIADELSNNFFNYEI